MTQKQIAMRLKAAKIYSVRTEVDALFDQRDALLEACKLALAYIHSLHNPHVETLLPDGEQVEAQINAAIAKAESEAK